MRRLRSRGSAIVLSVVVLATACSQPIEIIGQGDVVSESGTRTCTYEDHLTGAPACAQNVKSTFTRAEKDGSIGAVLELKKAVSVVDITAKLDHKGAANVTLENGTLVPKRESPPPGL